MNPRRWKTTNRKRLTDDELDDVPVLKFPKKNKRPKKTPIARVQKVFNEAIRRRDGFCVMDHSGHAGNLEASHFFSVGANGSLRFYPPNVHCQCTKHHKAEFHNDNPLPYADWMRAHVPELEFMEQNRKRIIRYTQPIRDRIEELCKADRLDELQDLITSMILEAI